ncbi:hypothetical protein AGR1C_pTi0095 [Agrobacterium fabacearum TT111]|nr:hypothetical protein AGR1C_pTi0095 [Agrobacterium fabacearum TT111]
MYECSELCAKSIRIYLRRESGADHPVCRFFRSSNGALAYQIDDQRRNRRLEDLAEGVNRIVILTNDTQAAHKHLPMFWIGF